MVPNRIIGNPLKTRTALRGVGGALDASVLNSPGYIGTAEEVYQTLNQAAHGTSSAQSVNNINATAAASVAPKNTSAASAYVAGGVAVAGVGAAALGAAALQQNAKRKESPSMLESAASTVVGGMDAVAGVAGTASGIGGLVIGLGAGMLLPVASGAAKWVGAKGLSDTLYKPVEYLNNTTVGDLAGSRLPQIAVKHIGNTAETLAGVAAKPLGVIAKVPGLGVFKAENIKSIPNQIKTSSLMHAGLNAAFITGSAVQMYGVTREFSGQLQALRELEADLSGKDVSQVSSAGVLLGGVSAITKEARSNLLKTTGSHLTAAAAGLGVNIGMAFNNRLHHLGGGLAMMGLYMLPEQISKFADGMFGESILPVYSGLRKAHLTGQAIPAETYGEFLLMANEKLRNRGNVGKQYAAALGAQYAAEKIAPAEILREIHDGKMQARIDALIAEHAAAQPAQAAAPKELSYAQRLQQQAQTPLQVAVRPEVGEFTKQLNERALAAMTPASPSMN